MARLDTFQGEIEVGNRYAVKHGRSILVVKRVRVQVAGESVNGSVEFEEFGTGRKRYVTVHGLRAMLEQGEIKRTL